MPVKVVETRDSLARDVQSSLDAHVLQMCYGRNVAELKKRRGSAHKRTTARNDGKIKRALTFPPAKDDDASEACYHAAYARGKLPCKQTPVLSDGSNDVTYLLPCDPTVMEWA